jgi:large conductance mechanosensitive channel
MLHDFKKFIQRGNVVDLAVAVVLGTAFGLVVKSFTDNVLMPLIGAITGGGSPTIEWAIQLRGKTVDLGAFLGAVINFLIVAFAVFIIVKAIEKAESFRQKEEDDNEIKVTEVKLLAEIRDLLEEQNGVKR